MRFTGFESIATKTATHTETHTDKITIIKIEDLEDVKDAIDALKDKQAVIANLTSLRDIAKVKAYQFLQGGIYAEDGQIKTISDSIYLIAPKNYEIEELVPKDHDEEDSTDETNESSQDTHSFMQ